MKILHETDTFQIAQYPNQMHALGLAMVLSSMTAMYGAEQVFNHTERLRGYIEKQQLAFYQLKGEADAPVSVPIGFISWGFLSRPIEIILTERFRPLMPQELRSGPNLWMLDICAPMEGATEMLDWLGQSNPKKANIYATRIRSQKIVKVTYKNKHHVKEG